MRNPNFGGELTGTIIASELPSLYDDNQLDPTLSVADIQDPVDQDAYDAMLTVQEDDYKAEVMNTLVTSMREFLTFSTPEDLLRLLAESL